MESLRVVCYLNQFFGQLGGEDKAGVGPQIVQTGDESARMLEDVQKIVALGLRLVRGEPLGAPAAEGYFARGVTRHTVVEHNAAERAVAMLTAKLAGQPFASEVPLPDFPRIPAPRLLKTLAG